MATQAERVAIGVLQNDMQTVKEDIRSMKADIKAISEKLDSKYAAKWTEWFVKGFIALVLVSAFTYIWANATQPKETTQTNPPNIQATSQPKDPKQPTSSPNVEASASAESTSDKPHDTETQKSTVGNVVDSILKGGL